jgi:hypothetical protein
VNTQALVALTSLLGVVLGGGLSYLVQRATQRAIERREMLRLTVETSERRRAERIACLERFLAAAQESERIAAERWRDGADIGTLLDREHAALERLWTAEKVIRVLGSLALRSPTKDYASQLHDLVRGGPGELSNDAVLKPARDRFFDAYRGELAQMEVARRSE